MANGHINPCKNMFNEIWHNYNAYVGISTGYDK